MKQFIVIPLIFLSINMLNAMEQNIHLKSAILHFRHLKDQNFFAQFLEEEKNKMDENNSLLCLEKFDEIDESLNSFEGPHKNNLLQGLRSMCSLGTSKPLQTTPQISYGTLSGNNRAQTIPSKPTQFRKRKRIDNETDAHKTQLVIKKPREHIICGLNNGCTFHALGQDQMDRHQMTPHSGEWECVFCFPIKFTAKSRSAHIQHVFEKHKGETYCKFCRRHISSSSNLREHLKRMHINKK